MPGKSKKSTDTEQKATVLVVEDDEGLNHLIRRTLAREGYQTEQALNGADAIESLQKDSNKILLLDYLLPDMTGLQVIRATKVEKLNVPFIIMTGYGDEKIAVDMMKQGVRDYIIKESGFVGKLPKILKRVINEIAAERELAKVEKALRQAAKEWQMTFDGISDVICLLDNEMKIKQCNTAMSAFLGKEPRKIIGRKCYELVHCTREPIEDCPLVRMKKTKQREQKILQVGDRWLDIEAHPLFDEKGNLTGAVHVITDITEFKKTEEYEKKHSEELSFLNESAIKFVELSPEEDIHGLIGDQLKKIVDESAVVVISEFDKDSGVFSAKAIFGIEKEIKHLKNVAQDPRTMAVPVDNELREVLTSGKLCKVNGGIYELSGRSIPKVVAKGIEKFMGLEQVYAMGLRRGKDIFGGICIYLRKGNNTPNISLIEAFVNQAAVALERKRDEVLVREERDRIQQYLDLAGVMFVAIDKNGIVNLINKKGCEILGYKEKDVVGKNWFDNFIPKHTKPVIKPVSQKLLKGKVDEAKYFENPVLTKDGKEPIIAWHNTVLTDEEGNIIGHLSSGEDITERTKAEKDLKESESRYRMLFDGSADGILVADIETKHFTHVNKSFCRMTGYSAEEVLLLGVTDLHPKEDLAWVILEFEAQARGEKTLAHAVPCIKKDGTIFYADINTTAVEINGRMCNVGFFRNISELIDKEEALRESEERFRQFFDNAPEYCYMISPEGKIIDANRTALTTLGYSKNELVGKALAKIYAPEAITKMKELFGEWEKNGKLVDQEMEIIKKNGEKRTVLLSAAAVRDAEGRIVYSVSIQKDITERKQSEEKILQAKKDWEQTFDTITDIVCLISHEHEFLEINETGCNSIGKSREDIIGKKCYNLIHNNDTPIKECPCQKATQTKMPASNEVTIGERHYLLSAWPILDKNKETTKFVHIVRDITEQKQAEEEKEKLQDQLQQAHKMEAIGQLAGGIAHDFNNILGGIVGYADVLELKIKNKTNLLKYVSKIKNAGLKASDLTRKLLTFARKARLENAPVNIHDMIKQIIEIFQHTIDKRIEIKSLLKAEKDVVEGDANQIENMLLNVGINARDAMPDGGILAFETENVLLDADTFLGESFNVTPGNYIRISIKDTGTGIDHNILNNIFEPFFTTKEIGKGTGLGLASVYGSVKQHDGYITVKSEPGKGAQFDIFLPEKEKGGSVKVSEKAEGIIPGTGSILVIDDEEDVRESISEMLDSIGYKVACCSNGEEAIKVYSEKYKEIDFVLLDLIMPRMSGLDCFRKLKEINPNIVTIVISGYSVKKDIDQILNEGADAIIEKPFEISQLVEIISRIKTKSEIQNPRSKI